MSKGNMFLGYARGSVGDVVFSRTNGQQITKARNRNPNNPRSISQMMQRSVFISAVKFYQLARAKFFKFAFEDKKTSESDFNAFMRHNTMFGTNMSSSAFHAYNYPALGDFVLSLDSLQPLRQWNRNNQFAAQTGIILGASDQLPTTIGALSQLLLRNERYREGDMFTLVDYGFQVLNSASVPAIQVNNDDYNTFFTWKQWKINTADTNNLNTIGISVEKDSTSNELLMLSTGEVFDETYRGMGLILSRNTSSGLLVTDTRLVMSGLLSGAITAAKDETYIKQVMTSWGAGDEAILSPRSVV